MTTAELELEHQLKMNRIEATECAERVRALADRLAGFVREYGYFPLYITDLAAEVRNLSYVAAQTNILYTMKHAVRKPNE
jgi:hypothetical protein